MGKILRCFIENDINIEDDDMRSIQRKMYFITNHVEIDFKGFFDIIITEADRKKKEVWEAILKCDEIYLSTAFCGESAYLLEDMCEMALRFKIRNKIIVNFRDSDSHLAITERGGRMLQILMGRNNVKYLSQDTEELKELLKDYTNEPFNA